MGALGFKSDTQLASIGWVKADTNCIFKLEEEESKGMGAGAVVLIIILVIVGLGVVGFLVYYFFIQKTLKNQVINLQQIQMTETPGANPDRPPVVPTEVHDPEEHKMNGKKQVIEQDIVVNDLENLAELKP